jgi:thiol-disulfide isomerase/thioredoxin
MKKEYIKPNCFKKVFTVLMPILVSNLCLSQRQTFIRFNWQNIDTSITSIRIGNNSDFWWTEPKPIYLFTLKRTSSASDTVLAASIETELQELHIFILGKTFSFLAKEGDTLSFSLFKQGDKKDIMFHATRSNQKNASSFQVFKDVTYSWQKEWMRKTNMPADTGNLIANYRAMSDSFLANAKEIKQSLGIDTVAIRSYSEAFLLHHLQTGSIPDLSKRITVLNNEINSLPTIKLSAVLSVLRKYTLQLAKNPALHQSAIEAVAESYNPFYKDYFMIQMLELALSENNNIDNEKAKAFALSYNAESHEQYVKKLIANRFILNHALPHNIIIGTKAQRLNGKTTQTLDNILKSINADIIIIDFWASWCAPCRDDMNNSSKAKKLIDSLGIQMVYFSIDKATDIQKWRKASKQEKLTGNQFLLTDGAQSSIATYFDVTYIPRYVVIKQGKIASLNLTRIRDENLTTLREELLKIMD